MDEDRVGKLERRLEELERRPTVRERGRGAMDLVMPAETRRHLRNAGREQLLAVRSMLDFWIDQLVESDAEPDQGREQIRID
jgi:hypothetical protein